VSRLHVVSCHGWIESRQPPTLCETTRVVGLLCVVCDVHIAEFILEVSLSREIRRAVGNHNCGSLLSVVLWCISRLLIAVGGIVGIVVVCSFAGAIGSVLQAGCELLEQESAFEAHLHDCSVQAGFALAGGIVGFFDVVEAALELDALSVVGLFY